MPSEIKLNFFEKEKIKQKIRFLIEDYVSKAFLKNIELQKIKVPLFSKGVNFESEIYGRSFDFLDSKGDLYEYRNNPERYLFSLFQKQDIDSFKGLLSTHEIIKRDLKIERKNISEEVIFLMFKHNNFSDSENIKKINESFFRFVKLVEKNIFDSSSIKMNFTKQKNIEFIDLGKMKKKYPYLSNFELFERFSGKSKLVNYSNIDNLTLVNNFFPYVRSTEYLKVKSILTYKGKEKYPIDIVSVYRLENQSDKLERKELEKIKNLFAISINITSIIEILLNN